MAPMPLGQLLELANKGVLYSNISSNNQNNATPDGGPSVSVSDPQVNLRSITLDHARKSLHALVLKAAHRSLIDGAIAEFLQEWIRAPKKIEKTAEVPVPDCPPGFMQGQQRLETSSLSPDVPPGFDVVSVLCIPTNCRFLFSASQDFTSCAYQYSWYCLYITLYPQLQDLSGRQALPSKQCVKKIAGVYGSVNDSTDVEGYDVASKYKPVSSDSNDLVSTQIQPAQVILSPSHTLWS